MPKHVEQSRITHFVGQRLSARTLHGRSCLKTLLVRRILCPACNPEVVEMTPSSLSNGGSMHQKHPPARLRFQAFSCSRRLISLLSMSRRRQNCQRKRPPARFLSSSSYSRPQCRERFSVEYKHQGNAVITPTLSCGRRTIIEHMSLMAATTSAVVLSPRNDQFVIGFALDMIRNRLEETWPSGAALKFRLRLEQWQIASRAHERPFAFFVIERA